MDTYIYRVLYAKQRYKHINVDIIFPKYFFDYKFQEIIKKQYHIKKLFKIV